MPTEWEVAALKFVQFAYRCEMGGSPLISRYFLQVGTGRATARCASEHLKPLDLTMRPNPSKSPFMAMGTSSAILH